MKLKSLALLSLGMFGFSSPLFAEASFKFTTSAPPDKKFHVVFIDDVDNLVGMPQVLDQKSGGQLSKLIQLNKFKPEKGNTLHLQMVGTVESLLLVGSQEKEGLSSPELQDLGGKIAH